jgi:hypothetical protein
VQPGDGVVGEQWLFPPGQRQVMPEVGGGWRPAAVARRGGRQRST